jgi:hypothetical protein
MTQLEKEPTPTLLRGPSAEGEDEMNTTSRSNSLTPNSRSAISQQNLVAPPEQPLPFKSDEVTTSSFCSPRKWTMLGIVLVVIACVIVVVLVNADDKDDETDGTPTASPSLRGE